ncbi:hypothetical protein [Robertmurraya korlensis]|uniref:hypothetical protein n=1 Tax=Robertmurraya korlensis TaxID=519977 RepID=UPI000824779E|nr:hypothetical protein [Robertmurraya korlensis]
MLKHVWKSYRIIQELLKEFPVSNTPVEQQMAPLLNGANTLLFTTLSTLQQSTLAKKQLKYSLSAIYQNAEEMERLTRTWVRVSTWMDSADSDEIEHRKQLLYQLHDQLKQIVPYIENLYGMEETLTIVPALYRTKKGMVSS